MIVGEGGGDEAEQKCADEGGARAGAQSATSRQTQSRGTPSPLVRSISATAWGFSSADRSPGGSPIYAARITRLMTLALRVFGRSATNSLRSGRSGLPNRAATNAFSSPTSAGPGVASARSTQKQTSACPFSSSGIPIAAASTTAGCSTSTDSTSAGPTRLPAILIVSSERPRMYQRPSSSIDAQSPWTQTSG